MGAKPIQEIEQVEESRPLWSLMVTMTSAVKTLVKEARVRKDRTNLMDTWGVVKNHTRCQTLWMVSYERFTRKTFKDYFPDSQIFQLSLMRSKQ